MKHPLHQIERIFARRQLFALCIASFIALIGCSDAYEQTGPDDILASGEICAPGSSDCPSQLTLERGTEVGANQLDFRLENLGEGAEITLKATVQTADVEDTVDLDAEGKLPTIPLQPRRAEEPDTFTLVERSYQLGAHEVIYDRLVSRELLTVPRFQLSLSCEDCSAALEFTQFSAALECRNDDECGGTWACNRQDGRCVECLKDSHCGSGQSCDPASNTCVPPELGGCATNSSAPAPLSVWVLGFLASIFLALKARRSFLARKRRRSAGRARVLERSGGALLFSALLFCLAAGFSQTAQAAAPSSALRLGVGPRFLSGKLGENTKRGIGLSVSQHVRGRYIGAQVTVGASYYLTTQQAPPLTNELQLYTVALGPQFYLPIEPVEVSLGADVRQVGLITNSLARITGPGLNYAAAGATAQVRYRLAGVSLILDGGFHPIIGLGSSLITLNISVGLETE